MKPNRAKNWTLTDRSEIAFAYNSGESIEALAKRYGLPLSTMRHRLMKAGVVFRRAGNPGWRADERRKGE